MPTGREAQHCKEGNAGKEVTARDKRNRAKKTHEKLTVRE